MLLSMGAVGIFLDGHRVPIQFRKGFSPCVTSQNSPKESISITPCNSPCQLEKRCRTCD